MYRIVKILNNNVAVVHTQDDKQMVVMGRGVAFQKGKGDLVDEKKVQKVFELKDQQQVTDLTTLLKNMPLDFITATYELIDEVQRKYHFSVESYIYVTLTTHLFAAYERLQNHTDGVNYLPDLSKNYPQAYEIADDILQGFKQKLNIAFPEYERKSIALHFINAHTDRVSQKSLPNNKPNRTQEIVQVIQDELLKYGIERNGKNDSDYDRLLIHLKYFVDRLDRNEPDTLKVSKSMIDMMRNEYADSWKIVDDISTKLNRKLKITISQTEKSYLAVHIQRLI